MKAEEGIWKLCGCPLDTRHRIRSIDYSFRQHECMLPPVGEHTKHYICDQAAYEDLCQEPPHTELGRWLAKRLSERRMFCAQRPPWPPPRQLAENTLRENRYNLDSRRNLQSAPSSYYSFKDSRQRTSEMGSPGASSTCTRLTHCKVVTPRTPDSERQLFNSPRSPSSPCSFVSATKSVSMPKFWRFLDKLPPRPLKMGWRAWCPDNEKLVVDGEFVKVKDYKKVIEDLFLWLRVPEAWRRKKLKRTAEAFILACGDNVESRGVLFKVDRVFVTGSHEFHVLVMSVGQMINNYTVKELKLGHRVGCIRRVFDIEIDAKVAARSKDDIRPHRHLHGCAHQHGKRPCTQGGVATKKPLHIGSPWEDALFVQGKRRNLWT